MNTKDGEKNRSNKDSSHSFKYLLDSTANDSTCIQMYFDVNVKKKKDGRTDRQIDR